MGRVEGRLSLAIHSIQGKLATFRFGQVSSDISEGKR